MFEIDTLTLLKRKYFFSIKKSFQLKISKIHQPVQASDGTNVKIIASDAQWIQDWDVSGAEATLESLTDCCEETRDDCYDINLRIAVSNFGSHKIKIWNLQSFTILPKQPKRTTRKLVSFIISNFFSYLFLKATDYN